MTVVTHRSTSLRVAKLLATLFTFILLALQAVALGQTPDSYVLGPDDVVTVTVVRHPEFSGDFLVPSDGMVDLPVVGHLKLTGVKLNDLTKLVTEKLSTRLKKPEVSVVLKTARVQRIYVLGTVKAPGAYPWKTGWRLTEGLSAAGGIDPSLQIADVTVTVLRAGTGEKVNFPLADVLSGAPDKNLTINPDDVVTLDSVVLVPVYVMGSVRAPGQYRLRKDSTGVLEAITLAGGTTDGAALSTVKVVHLAGGEEVVDLAPALLRGESIKAPKLATGDLVIVPESQARVAVLGYVAKPGFYPVPEGKPMLLSEAVAVAGGADAGRMSKVAVIRMANGKQVKNTYDLGKFLKTGDVKNNPTIFSGDVVYIPESARVGWPTILNSLSTAGILFRAFGK